MTEDDAIEKWCPFARVVVSSMSDTGITTHNRAVLTNAASEAQTRCIASECMAWREGPDPYRKGNKFYCGLAGKP